MPELKKPVFLCGMMGSGKSTVGPELAGMMHVQYKDLDQLIEEKEQMKIPTIFKEKGEHYFREIEQNLLIQQTEKPEGVLALGGGSLQNQFITDHVKLAGWLVYLDVPVETLVQRLSGSKGRPKLLQAGNKNVTNQIKKLLGDRLPFYTQAHLSIKTGTLTPAETARSIIKKLKIYES